MKWFGPKWNAPVNKDCPATKTPVGVKCVACGKPIGLGDRGVTMPYIADPSLPAKDVPYHLACLMKQILGFVPEGAVR